MHDALDGVELNTWVDFSKGDINYFRNYRHFLMTPLRRGQGFQGS
jgi:hypothetical protein